MRVAIGGYLVAANSFATQQIGLERFQRAMLREGAVMRMARGEGALGGFAQAATSNGWDVVPLNFVFPGLAGKISDEAHEWSKQELLSAIRKAGKLDGIFLQMHGTAATDRIDDCEGDLL